MQRKNLKSDFFIRLPTQNPVLIIEIGLHSKYIRPLFGGTRHRSVNNMDQSVTQKQSSIAAERLVRYKDLRPCTTAFIDTRTPGSAEKENFTIIGPGVAENPDQYVHINIPHGFNIGGARQPPGCVNSQHSHETAEVFVVHSGHWAFQLGPDCEDGEVLLGPGDIISIPIHVFRGFKNVGDEVGFLFAILGGDDPGHVTWAPYVFDNAKEYGLILLEDGSLVDTTKGESIPEGKRAMAATTCEDVDRRRRLNAAEMAGCVMASSELPAKSGSVRSLPGALETPIIGGGSAAEKLVAGKMAWEHGFHLRHLELKPGKKIASHKRHEEEVIFLHSGGLTVTLPDGELQMVPGDVLTVPLELPRAFSNSGPEAAVAYVVRGSNRPGAAEFVA